MKGGSMEEVRLEGGSKTGAEGAGSGAFTFLSGGKTADGSAKGFSVFAIVWDMFWMVCSKFSEGIKSSDGFSIVSIEGAEAGTERL